MITFTRRTARTLRAVIRRALGTTRGSGPAVSFHAGPDGLSVRVRQGGAAVEYQEPGSFSREELAVPFELFGDCEAAKDDPVAIAAEGAGVVASWNDGGIGDFVQSRRTAFD